MRAFALGQSAGVSEKEVDTLDQVPLALYFPEITKRLKPLVLDCMMSSFRNFKNIPK
jgi:hypothetical protein